MLQAKNREIILDDAEMGIEFVILLENFFRFIRAAELQPCGGEMELAGAEVWIALQESFRARFVFLISTPSFHRRAKRLL